MLIYRLYGIHNSLALLNFASWGNHSTQFKWTKLTP